MNSLILSLSLFILSSFCVLSQEKNLLQIIPNPQDVEIVEGYFEINQETAIEAEESLTPTPKPKS